MPDVGADETFKARMMRRTRWDKRDTRCMLNVSVVPGKINLSVKYVQRCSLEACAYKVNLS